MSYFLENHYNIKYNIEANGLRNAQIGAIHAISSHFTLFEKEPALVVMPTGTGKTAVLIMAAFIERAKRVLVISSSVLVRGQIKEEFESLKTLKQVGVVSESIDLPKVFEIITPIRSNEQWTELENYDVVIGIPPSINIGISEDIYPNPSLFDLILVDEAHHAAATTWNNILNVFHNSKKIFFTATPFRRDKKEVLGRIVYNYPLSRAKKDRVFGEIGFIPITPDTNETVDLALAKAAEKQFNEDRENGFDHYILIRTNTKKHAKELEKVYEENTTLNLRRIDSKKTYKYIKQTVRKLKDKLLDGIICVDMLGEGFDFPNLKIGVLHQPHKSLAITLQFIGRFARTNASNIGQAKFLALPNDLEIGTKQLFSEGAIWNDLIVDLSQDRIIVEDLIKNVINSFNREEDDLVREEAENISIYNLNPYCHVKIYRVTDFNIEGYLDISGHEIVHHFISEENSAIIFISKVTQSPKWINSDEIVDVNFFLFLIFFDEETNLVFIHSAIKTPQFYDLMIEKFTNNPAEKISKYDLHKVLSGLSETEIFSLGMQNRSINSGESYRTISGSHAHNSIKKTDGRMYSNGHIYGKAKNEEDTKITIGYSSGSKVWSNAYEKIPIFINWCREIGRKIESDVIVKTHTGLDHLPIGVKINNFPEKVYAAIWNRETFSDFPDLNIVSVEGELLETVNLLEFDIIIDKDQTNNQELSFDLTYEKISIPLKFSFQDHYSLRESSDFLFNVFDYSIEEYLNEYPLQFYLNDFSAIIYNELHKPNQNEILFPAEQIFDFDWVTNNTDIEIEFYDPTNPRIKLKADNNNKDSIHETIHSSLFAQDYDLIVYDHGTGEMADYITFKESPDSTMINLFHIKGSGGKESGDRVNDVYEVCGQAIKSLLWTSNKNTFNKKFLQRVNSKPQKFIKGDLTQYKALISKGKMLSFTFTIVQPGVSKNNLSSKISSILAAANDYINGNGNNEQLNVWASLD
ncbi:DEAD/DEAH box helicase [Adhaeribacter radiodurans]|uniref:DEAD/DEAH box helicase family protein n=1 Tax=Adhaeribacter radiodurans TaxID=2745197 RepID=A0A7L7L181_9BACT|nr:DEAD/DEAH box helicase family protein [Adhaeribacter radiodurans]QMU26553.1 DEAD/DEAH box helicase family protein [Adhaeribacter radiodurans]